MRQILDFIKNEEACTFKEFVDFVIQNELGCFVKDISRFPAIEESWDEPRIIKCSIIELRNMLHDFKNIFTQLSELGCRDIELRCYKNMTLKDIRIISNKLSNDSIRCLTIILPYFKLAEQITNSLADIISQSHHRLHLSFYSVPEDIISQQQNLPEIIKGNIRYSSKAINGCSDCGVIDIKRMSVPTLQQYMENKLYNSCLNRLVSIDESGNIKNCPSFGFSYGNIKDTPLAEVVHSEKFQAYWFINKEQVETCCNCEFRVLCKDCRAYVCDENNIYSKPSKCNYSPYTNKYEK